MSQHPLFTASRSAGVFTLRPLHTDDAPLVHRWATREAAHFWGMQGQSIKQVSEFYQRLTAHSPQAVLIGCCNGKPSFLLECYRACDDDIASFYPAAPDDYGMHLLLAPADRPIRQFSWQVFTVVMDYLFSRSEVRRVVVEPDVRNDNIHRLNRRAGFRYQHTIEMGHKTAWLAFCQRQDYQQALQQESPQMNTPSPLPMLSGAHLTGENWVQANRMLIRKAIAEFSHERILAPHPCGNGRYQLAVPGAEADYQFTAVHLALDHWEIDAASLCKQENGRALPLDALQFIVEFREQIGVSQALLATYMEEISSTLCSSVYKRYKRNPGSKALINADFQTIEAAMSEGHPCFVANNGRIGFDAQDYLAFSPEAAAPIRLIWVAVHRRNAHFSCLSSLSYDQLMREELGDDTVRQFTDVLTTKALTSNDYLFMPVHPWQWHNKLLTVFATDIANNEIVYLGNGEDHYQAQQSVRTFFNRSQPTKRYVKTALSVLNMGFMRGLSPYYMATTPAINEWLAGVVTRDTWLQRCDFRLLREVATVGYHNRHYEHAIQGDSAYKKMFAALWRDNPMRDLKPNQRLMTMAAFLHSDDRQQPLLPALIAASGVSPGQWLHRYLNCYLSPLLHCFYHYDLVFMPHGENLIMLLDNHLPVAVWMKDLGEEILVMHADADLPENVRRIAVDVPDNMKLLSIFTDVFDCIFRFISAILHSADVLHEDRFWQTVAQCIKDYQQAHPQLASKFARYDLFTPEFPRSCLNRLQLANNQQMVNLSDPAANLKLAGTLVNPVARWR